MDKEKYTSRKGLMGTEPQGEFFFPIGRQPANCSLMTPAGSVKNLKYRNSRLPRIGSEGTLTVFHVFVVRRTVVAMADEEADPNIELRASLIAAAAEKNLQAVNITFKPYFILQNHYLHRQQ